MKNNYLKTLLFLFFVTHLIAQQKYNIEQISIPDGLSTSAVSDILQDQYRFLWIATQDGLNRFDGYNFKIYKHEPGDKKSLASNDVLSLMIDNEGILWAGTNAGLCKYNLEKETFTTVLPDSSWRNLQQNRICILLHDNRNRIWLSTFDGIFMFDKITGKITRTFIKDGSGKIPSSGLSGKIIETSTGEIYSVYNLEGLIKYNESTGLFEFVNVKPSDPEIFKNVDVVNLYEDKTGRIWISTIDGLYNYDPHTGDFNEIKLFKKVSSPTVNLNNIWVNSVFGMIQDDKGFLWIGTGGNGIFLYNLKTGGVSQLDQSEFPNSVQASDGFWKFYIDEFGILWIGTHKNGLLKLDFHKEPFRLFPNPTDKITANSNMFITSIYQDPSDNNFIWLGSGQGLLYYNLKDKAFKSYKHQAGKPKVIQDNRIQTIRPGSKQELWLGTTDGLSKMNLSNKSFTDYDLSETTKHYSIGYNTISDLSMDDKGNLWIASGLSGAVKFDPENKVKLFIPTLDVRTYDLKLLGFIDSLNETNNALAKLTKVGNDQDLKKEFKLEKQTNVMIVAVGEGARVEGMADYGWLQDSKRDTAWSQANYYNSFYCGGALKNRISIGIITLNKGNYTLRFKSDDSHSYGNWNEPPPFDSTLWGIQVFDLSGSDINNYKSLLADSRNKPFINALKVTKVKYQKDGTVLIGTSSGLNKYDINRNSIENLQVNYSPVFAPNLKQINDLLVDKNNVIWLATNGGLIKYDQNIKKFTVLNDKDGLPSDYIMAMEEDTYGNLWLSTLNGISKFNKDINSPIFINYNVKDGLQGYKFTERASFECKSGDIFFAGQNGFNAFRAGNINLQVPKINITQFKISNELVLPFSANSPLTKSILDTKQIELAYNQNSISFEFTAIQFSRPEKNLYAYRLDGFDKNGWIYDNRRLATYTNLAPGDYVFRVKASNGDGVWNEAGTSINIRVLPPLWRTFWAYIGYVFIFGGLVFGIDRRQRRRLLLKERQRQRLENSELRAQIAEAESARKTKELNEARELQLSMLPKELPQLPHLDIAVYMKTATEVGGDYYDFNVALDGTLTVVLGDATGHGMMSGMMVSIMKSLFMSDRINMELKPFFENASTTLKDMQLGRLMMALTSVQIKEDRIITTNAGMPPLFIYRAGSQTVEEVVINNMPLGAMKGIVYDAMELKIEHGDTLLLMSDGFAELKNDNSEIYGYIRARNSFEKVAKQDPEQIVTYLRQEGRTWTGDKEPEDDVTFVLIKII
jgi:ligand-binding sensor domain-containing protein/serine phosphatase RsbU (regulator of sigma subunit)